MRYPWLQAMLWKWQVRLASRRALICWLDEQTTESERRAAIIRHQADWIDRLTLERVHQVEVAEHFERSAMRWRAAAEQLLAGDSAAATAAVAEEPVEVELRELLDED